MEPIDRDRDGTDHVDPGTVAGLGRWLRDGRLPRETCTAHDQGRTLLTPNAFFVSIVSDSNAYLCLV
jgi:hypothetical protein